MTTDWRRPASVMLVAILAVTGLGCGKTGQVIEEVKPLRNLFSESERIAWLPHDEKEYSKVFAKLPDGAQVNKNISSLDALKAPGSLREFVPAAKSISQQTVDVVATTTKPIITVVGHNENGVLKAVDGSILPLQRLADAAPKNTVVLVLSCNAEWYVSTSKNVIGPFTKIDPTAAADIERAFYAQLDLVVTWPPSKAQLNDAYTVASAAYDKAKRTRKVAIVAGASGAGGSGGLLVYIETHRADG